MQVIRVNAIFFLLLVFLEKKQAVILAPSTLYILTTDAVKCASADPEGGTGGPDPPGKSQFIPVKKRNAPLRTVHLSGRSQVIG